MAVAAIGIIQSFSFYWLSPFDQVTKIFSSTLFALIGASLFVIWISALQDSWILESDQLSTKWGWKTTSKFSVNNIESIQPSSTVDPDNDWLGGPNAKHIFVFAEGKKHRLSAHVENRVDLLCKILEIHEKAHGERLLDQYLPTKYRKAAILNT